MWRRKPARSLSRCVSAQRRYSHHCLASAKRSRSDVVKSDDGVIFWHGDLRSMSRLWRNNGLSSNYKRHCMRAPVKYLNASRSPNVNRFFDRHWVFFSAFDLSHLVCAATSACLIVSVYTMVGLIGALCAAVMGFDLILLQRKPHADKTIVVMHMTMLRRSAATLERWNES